MKTKNKSISYDEWLREELSNNSDLCALFLDDCAKEDDPRVFLLALRYVIEARKMQIKDYEPIWESVLRGLKQKTDIDLGSFAKYVDELEEE